MASEYSGTAYMRPDRRFYGKALSDSAHTVHGDLTLHQPGGEGGEAETATVGRICVVSVTFL